MATKIVWQRGQAKPNHVAQLRRLLLMRTSEVRCAGDDEAERARTQHHERAAGCMRKARRLGEAELTAAQLSR